MLKSFLTEKGEVNTEHHVSVGRFVEIQVKHDSSLDCNHPLVIMFCQLICK